MITFKSKINPLTTLETLNIDPNLENNPSLENKLKIILGLENKQGLENKTKIIFILRIFMLIDLGFIFYNFFIKKLINKSLENEYIKSKFSIYRPTL